jgi:hypothetical protein
MKTRRQFIGESFKTLKKRKRKKKIPLEPLSYLPIPQREKQKSFIINLIVHLLLMQN